MRGYEPRLQFKPKYADLIIHLFPAHDNLFFLFLPTTYFGLTPANTATLLGNSPNPSKNIKFETLNRAI